MQATEVDAEYVRSIFNLMRKKPPQANRAALLKRLEQRYAFLPIHSEINALMFQLKCIEGAFDQTRLQVTDLRPEIDPESKRLSILMALEGCLEGIAPDERVQFFDARNGKLTFRDQVYEVKILASNIAAVGLYRAIAENAHFLVLDQMYFQVKSYDIVLLSPSQAHSILEKPTYRWASKVFMDVLKGKE